MKLSFSLNPKPKLEPRINPLEEKSNHTDDKRNRIIILPLENKMKHLEIITKAKPTDDPKSRFELEAAPTSAAIGDQGFKYGLTLREKEDDMVVDDNGAVFVPSSIEKLMLKKFKEDMEKLPEDRGLDEFIDCPVEGYGEALLAGYGWKKGRWIGKNAKGDVKVFQCVRRIGREGLGYEPEAEIDGKKKNRRRLSPKGRDCRVKASSPYHKHSAAGVV